MKKWAEDMTNEIKRNPGGYGIYFLIVGTVGFFAGYIMEGI